MAKTYGQFCALARALDHVGDRWSLLIVRELLLRSAGYGELQTALEGIPTNLLADRLRTMCEDGIVERQPSDGDRRRVTYRLTPLGLGLGPVVDALIVWGGHWMSPGPGDDRFDPRWAGLALRALLAERLDSFTGTVEFRFEDGSMRIVGTQDPTSPQPGREHVGAAVEGPATLLLALASGDLSLDDAAEAGVSTEGDRQLLRRVLR